jgi:hypothetical protein
MRIVDAGNVLHDAVALVIPNIDAERKVLLVTIPVSRVTEQRTQGLTCYGSRAGTPGGEMPIRGYLKGREFENPFVLRASRSSARALHFTSSLQTKR